MNLKLRIESESMKISKVNLYLNAFKMKYDRNLCLIFSFIFYEIFIFKKAKEKLIGKKR